MQADTLNGYEKRPYVNGDIKNFQKNYGLTSNELANAFFFNGMSPSAVQNKIKNSEDLLSPTLQIILRLYSRYPELIPIPERITAIDFFENELGGESSIATRFRGALLGVDRNSGYNWSKDSTPESSVKAAMIAAKKLKKIKNLEQTELLQVLIDVCNTTAATLEVNPMKAGSWRSGSNEQPLQLSVSNVCEKSVKNRGKRVYLQNVPKMTSTNYKHLTSDVRAKLSILSTAN